MNLAILHYHLNRGGVTQVILNHLRALDSAVVDRGPLRVTLLYGGQRTGWPEELASQLQHVQLLFCEVPSLDYDQEGHVDAAELHRLLCAALSEADCPPDETVLHVHNHSLGKHVALPGALQKLAETGYPLLLQIHDFAEDFRPDNYRALAAHWHADGANDVAEALYPQASHVHYAVLNSRDEEVLLDAGMHRARLHLLPNPVSEFGLLPPTVEARVALQERFGVPLQSRYVLYPVRGIRRKNLGEALLWAAMAPPETHFGFTLPPLNPLEKPSYNAWRQLAEELSLPCAFGTGGPEGLSLPQNLACADAILTTSVAEGFGMVFLECWPDGRPLIGRDLPEITQDFKRAGVQYDRLYSRFCVPIEWIGRNVFVEHFTRAYSGVLREYGRPVPPPEALREEVDGLIEQETVDFAALDRGLQQSVIRRVHGQRTHQDELHRLNPWLKAAFTMTESQVGKIVAHNATVVRESFSPAACGRRLWDIYQMVAASARDETIEPLPNGEIILSAFLNVHRFHPFRIEA